MLLFWLSTSLFLLNFILWTLHGSSTTSIWIYLWELTCSYLFDPTCKTIWISERVWGSAFCNLNCSKQFYSDCWAAMSNKLLKKYCCYVSFLLSFSGKYLAHDYGPESSHLQTGRNIGSNGNHQLYRIRVPQTEANHFGPVFIEVDDY